MRIVLDTNVWLSAIFWEGEASRILELAERKKLSIVISRKILLEVSNVLIKEQKFQEFLTDMDESIHNIIRTILSLTELADGNAKTDIIKIHPPDNVIIETAVDGKADYIISYDKHLLNLKEFEKIKIVEPSYILRIFSQSS